MGLDMSPGANKGNQVWVKVNRRGLSPLTLLKTKKVHVLFGHAIFLLGLPFRERALQLPWLVNKRICSSENNWWIWTQGNKNFAPSFWILSFYITKLFLVFFVSYFLFPDRYKLLFPGCYFASYGLPWIIFKACYCDRIWFMFCYCKYWSFSLIEESSFSSFSFCFILGFFF